MYFLDSKLDRVISKNKTFAQSPQFKRFFESESFVLNTFFDQIRNK